MSAQRQKGTSFETMLVEYLKVNGFIHVYRPATKGAKDTGDINGIIHNETGRNAIVQAKNQKAMKLSEWLNATVEQGKQHGNAVPILAVKRPRVGERNLGSTYCILRLDDVLGLLAEAGYS